MRSFQILLLSFVLFNISFAQTKQTTWKVNDLKKIGGHQTTILGKPKVIKAEKGKAVEFNGVDDGVFLDTNPLEGTTAFTIEAIFRPQGGDKEQRWFHIEQYPAAEKRVLLEIRVVENQWFLDSFMKSGDNRLAHYAENFKHPLNEWFHVALVYDGNEMSHYVNGKLELTGKIQITPFGKGKTSLGVRQNKVYWFKGAISKVRVTNKALTPKEFMKK